MKIRMPPCCLHPRPGKKTRGEKKKEPTVLWESHWKGCGGEPARVPSSSVEDNGADRCWRKTIGQESKRTQIGTSVHVDKLKENRNDRKGRICILCFESACVLIEHTKGKMVILDYLRHLDRNAISRMFISLWTLTNNQTPLQSHLTALSIYFRHKRSCRRTCHNKILKPWLILPFFFH